MREYIWTIIIITSIVWIAIILLYNMYLSSNKKRWENADAYKMYVKGTEKGWENGYKSGENNGIQSGLSERKNEELLKVREIKHEYKILCDIVNEKLGNIILKEIHINEKMEKLDNIGSFNLEELSCFDCPFCEKPDPNGSCTVGLGIITSIEKNQGCDDWKTCKFSQHMRNKGKNNE